MTKRAIALIQAIAGSPHMHPANASRMAEEALTELTRQPVPGVYDHREPGEFGEGVTVRSEWPHLIQLCRTLGLLASAVKSGEAWSETLQREYDLANQAARDAYMDLNRRLD